MNNYGYIQGLLFFMISRTNMSSNFIKLSMDGFLTQCAFHRVQEHPNRSLDEGVMTFPSWRSYVVTPRQDDLTLVNLVRHLGLTPAILLKHMNRFLINGPSIESKNTRIGVRTKEL